MSQIQLSQTMSPEASSPTAPPSPSLLRVLLIDDNTLDAKAIIRAANLLNTSSEISHVLDGATALEVLRENPAIKRPDLVLLDLDLAGLDGRDVLSAMKSDPILRRMPVVILTTSDDDADVTSSYDLGANAFITKPTGLAGWLEVVEHIQAFWFSLVRLPPA